MKSRPVQVADKAKAAYVGTKGEAVTKQYPGKSHDRKGDEGLQQCTERVLAPDKPGVKECQPRDHDEDQADEVSTQAVSPLSIMELLGLVE